MPITRERITEVLTAAGGLPYGTPGVPDNYVGITASALALAARNDLDEVTDWLSRNGAERGRSHSSRLHETDSSSTSTTQPGDDWWLVPQSLVG